MTLIHLHMSFNLRWSLQEHHFLSHMLGTCLTACRQCHSPSLYGRVLYSNRIETATFPLRQPPSPSLAACFVYADDQWILPFATSLTFGFGWSLGLVPSSLQSHIYFAIHDFVHAALRLTFVRQMLGKSYGGLAFRILLMDSKDRGS